MQYSKRLGNDSFEVAGMKRFVERDRQSLSVVDRIVGGYFLLANVMGDSTYYSMTKTAAKERRVIWQAFFGGNLTPMREYISNREFSAKMADGTLKVDIDDPLFGV
ncbi:MAG: hypothetical protein GC179_20700 [Anaerolineaceae bacterium]|nr:hypothetical protein [Anaerolineaceae bacterium]